MSAHTGTHCAISRARASYTAGKQPGKSRGTTAYEVAPPQGKAVDGLLIVLPLRLVGATASPVRPIGVA